MKLRCWIFGWIIIGLSLTILMDDSIAEEMDDPVLIETYHEDLTGDGFQETVQLYGLKLAKDSNYFQDLWSVVTFVNDKQIEIRHDGGYIPELHFSDFTHTGTGSKDIMMESAKTPDEDKYNYQIYSIQKREAKKIPIPVREFLKGKFKDQFKIHLQFSPTQEPTVIDVTDDAKKYVDLGIYDEKGKLIRATSIHPQKASRYEPVYISTNKGYGLKSYQDIYGADKEDFLGAIETLWYYKDDSWNIIQTHWKTSGEKREKIPPAKGGMT